MAPTKEELLKWDEAHLWHPFTPHAVYASESPLLIVEGEGNYLIDVDGRRYLDGVASLWCNTFGHRVPEINAAIEAQLQRIAHATLLGHSCQPAIELSKRLVDLSPSGLDKVFFSDNGSTSVEVALKMAYQYWQQSPDKEGRARTQFLALDRAYHGDTIGAVSLGGISLFHECFESLVFDTVRAPSPYTYRRPDGMSVEAFAVDYVQRFEQVVRSHHEVLAAIVLEPGLQGAGGFITYPDGFLQQVRALCDELGIFLILDEVAVGMGRSGKMFACEKEGVSPDFLCIAKGLTGGYLPLAATLTTRRVFDAFLGRPENGKTFFHGHTYTGNALGAAAALATLDLFQSNDVIRNLEPKIGRLREALKTLETEPGVGDIRQYGLAAGIELILERQNKTPFLAGERRGMRVCKRAMEKGVFLRPLGDLIVLMPPLSITEEEITTLVDAVRYGLRAELTDAR